MINFLLAEYSYFIILKIRNKYLNLKFIKIIIFLQQNYYIKILFFKKFINKK